MRVLVHTWGESFIWISMYHIHNFIVIILKTRFTYSEEKMVEKRRKFGE